MRPRVKWDSSVNIFNLNFRNVVSLQRKVKRTNYEIPKCVKFSIPCLLLVGQQVKLNNFMTQN
jgi:hypothetical protein